MIELCARIKLSPYLCIRLCILVSASLSLHGVHVLDVFGYAGNYSYVLPSVSSHGNWKGLPVRGATICIGFGRPLAFEA